VKKLLNTLFVTTPEAWVHRERETVVIKKNGEQLGKFPIHLFQGIVCIGHDVLVSPHLMALCAERGVTISYFNENGRFQARVEGPVSGNVLLRKQQYRMSDHPELMLPIVRACVAAKIQNARTNLQRHIRNHPDKENSPAIKTVVQRLAHQIKKVAVCNDLEELRGYEGAAADDYFSAFDHLIVCQRKDFSFSRRSRRPPLDRVNAMLSFVYTLMTHDIRSALEGVGLDPAVGFLHRDRPGRPSLALDILEEFRHSVADRLVLSLINLQMVQGKGFQFGPTGAVEMDEETRKILLTSWQKRKQEEIRHPYLGESAPLGIFPHIQARLLARTIRGDLENYPAFISK
jgi:CRISPR-associated protein Cas1